MQQHMHKIIYKLNISWIQLHNDIILSSSFPRGLTHPFLLSLGPICWGFREGCCSARFRLYKRPFWSIALPQHPHARYSPYYCCSWLDTRVNSNCGSSIVVYDFVCLSILKWSTLVFVIFILLTYEYFPHWFSWNWVWQKKIPIFFNAPLQQWIARIKINEIRQTMINDGSHYCLQSAK